MGLFEFKTLRTLLSIKEAKMGIETYLDSSIKFHEAHKQQIITFLEAAIEKLKKDENKEEARR